MWLMSLLHGAEDASGWLETPEGSCLARTAPFTSVARLNRDATVLQLRTERP